MANEQNNQAQVTQEKYMNAPLWRVFLADLLTKVENWFITKYNAALQVLTNSAWAAGNSVNVGMAETAEVLNPMLAQPSTEQIYTTQPQWDFTEGQTLQLGSTATIDDVEYPIPSIIYDTKGAPHTVFPVWSAQWDGHYYDSDGGLLDAQAESLVYEENGHYYCPEHQGYEVWKHYAFGFKPMPITYRHNCNYLGGGLDGFAWQEVSLISGSSVEVTGDAQTGFTASVPTTDTVKVGTWVRLTYTESDASKTAYGYVSAVETGNVTVTVVGACGTTVTKVELYKPVGQ